MQGGSFTINNAATVTGSGVMIYVDSSGGGISLVAALHPRLRQAPDQGTYTGVVLYVD